MTQFGNITYIIIIDLSNIRGELSFCDESNYSNIIHMYIECIISSLVVFVYNKYLFGGFVPYR